MTMSKTKFTLVTVCLMALLFCIPFNTIRAAGGSFGGGDGSAATPYIVEDEADLRAIATGDLTAYYKLKGNITLTSAWVPIGTSGTPFTGGFDGGSFVIRNLYVNVMSDYVGLFGYTDGAVFKNTRVVVGSAGVKGGDYVGGFVGRAVNSTFTNCHVEGVNVTGTKNVWGIVGGFAGQITGAGSSVTGCSATGVPGISSGTVVGAAYVGGFVGYLSAGAAIHGSYAEVDVTANGLPTEWFAGGFVGFAYNGVTITSCYATGDVTGTVDNVGGFAGSANGQMDESFGNLVTITDCYATGDATGNNYVGGFVGYTIYGAEIDNCYAAGKATATGGIREGGFVGTKDDSYSTINNASWNEDENASGSGGWTGGGGTPAANLSGLPASGLNPTIIGLLPSSGWVENSCLGGLVFEDLIDDLIAEIIHVESFEINDLCSEDVKNMSIAEIIALDPSNVVPSETRFSWKITSVATGAVTRNGSLLQQDITTGSSIDELDLGQLFNTTTTLQTIIFTVTPEYDRFKGNQDPGFEPWIWACKGADFTVTVNLIPIPHITTHRTDEICSDGVASILYVNDHPSNGGDGVVPISLLSYDWKVISANGISTNSVPGNDDTDAADAVGVPGVPGGGGNTLLFDAIKNNTDEEQVVEFEVTPITSSVCPGEPFFVTVTVNPEPQIADINLGSICSINDEILISRSDLQGFNAANVVPTVTRYDWVFTSATPSATITPASGSDIDEINIGAISNPLPIAVTVVYTVTPTYVSASGKECAGDPFTITVVVNPTPEIEDMTRTVCSNDNLIVIPIHGVDGIVPLITRYEWAVTDGEDYIDVANATGNSTALINLGRIHNNDCDAQEVEITVTPFSRNFEFSLFPFPPSFNFTGECEGEPFKITVTVNPTPELPDYDTIVCSNDLAVVIEPVCDAANGIIVPSGTTYEWTVVAGGDVITICAPDDGFKTDAQDGNCGGSGIIDLGVIKNYTNAPVTVTFEVIPTVGTCEGDPFHIDVLINPTPVIADYNVTRVCSYVENISTSESVLRAAACDNIVPVGTVFSWTVKNQVPAGMTDATSGSSTGSVDIGYVHNFNDNLVVVTYEVTPKYIAPDGKVCEGAPFDYYFRVIPRPEIVDFVDTICGDDVYELTPMHGFGGGIIAGNSADSVVPIHVDYTWDVTALMGDVIVGNPTGTNVAGGTIDLGTITNTTNDIATLEIVVTPRNIHPSYPYKLCSADDFTITLVVMPKPVIDDIDTIICSHGDLVIIPENDGGKNGTDVVPENVRYEWEIVAVNPNVDCEEDGIEEDQIDLGTFVNKTTQIQFVTYEVIPYAVMADGSECEGDPFFINVSVNPTPEINDFTDTICSGDSHSVSPVNGTDGLVPTLTNSIVVNTSGLSVYTAYTATTYDWDVDYSDPGSNGGSGSGEDVEVANPTGTGASSINFGVFTNNTGEQQKVVFTVTPTATTTATTVTMTITPTPPFISVTTNSVSEPACPGEPFEVEVVVNPVPDILDTTVFVCSNGEVDFAMQDGINGIVPAEHIRYDWIVKDFTGATELELDGTLIDGTETGSFDQITVGILRNICIDEQVLILEVTPVDTLYGCSGHTFDVTIVVSPTAEITEFDGYSEEICSNEAPTILYPAEDCTSGGDNIVPDGTNYSWEVSNGADITPMSGISKTNGAIDLGELRNNLNVQQSVIISITPKSAPVAGGLAIAANPTDSCEGEPFEIEIIINPTPEIADDTLKVCSGEYVHLTYKDGERGGDIVPAGTTYTWVKVANEGGVSRPNGDMIPDAGGSSSSRTVEFGQLYNKDKVDRTIEFLVTPTSPAGCTGTPFVVHITVKPELAVTLTSDYKTICADGGAIEFTALASTPDGETYDYDIDYYALYADGKYVTSNDDGEFKVDFDTEFDAGGKVLDVRTDPYNFYVVARTAPEPDRWDSIFCESRSNIVVINVKAKATVKANLNYAKACVGGSIIATADVMPVGSYEYEWKLKKGSGAYSVISRAQQVTIDNFTVAETDSLILMVVPSGITNGCEVADTVVFEVVADPISSFVTTATTICTGETVDVISQHDLAVSDAGFVREWSVNGVVIAGATDSILTHTNNVPGTYSYRVRMVSTDALDCGSLWSQPVVITVEALPIVNITVDNNIYCGDEMATFTVAVTNPPSSSVSYTYELFEDGNLVNNADITNGVITLDAAGKFEFTVPVYRPAAYNYYVEAKSSTGNCVGRSNTVSISVKEAPVVKITPSSANVCAGGSVTATAGVEQAGSYNYSWYLDDVLVQSGLVAQYNVSNLTVAGTPHKLKVTVVPVSGGNGCVGKDSIEINVVADPNVVLTPEKPIICTGEIVKITSEITNTNATITGSSYTHEWSVNGLVIAGETSDEYNSVLNVPGTYIYRMRMISNDNLDCGSVWSAPVTVVVEAKPTIILRELDGDTYCIDSYTGLKATVTNPVGAAEDYTYKLYNGGAYIESNNTGLFTSQEISAGLYEYWVVATSPSTAACDGTSNSVFITVKDAPTVNIVTVPADAKVCKDGSITATAVPTPAGDYNYTWTLGGAVVASGRGVSEVTLDNLTVGTPQLKVVIVPFADSNGCEADKEVAINVVADPTVSVEASAPAICAGSTATITATPAGFVSAVTVYEWTVNGVPVIGTGSTLSQVLNVPGTYSYAARIVSTDGLDCGSIWSDPAVVTVEAMPEVTLTVDNSIYCVGGSGETLRTAITPATGLSYDYMLYKNGGSTPDQTNSSGVFTINETTADSYGYYVVVKSTGTGVAGCEGTSNTVTVTVNEAPTVVVSLNRNNICANGSVTATAVVTPTGNYTYKWILDGNTVGNADNVIIENLQEGQYPIHVEVASAEGYFGCTATSIVGTGATAKSDTIYVIDVPVARVSTPDTIMCSSSDVTLTAQVYVGIVAGVETWADADASEYNFEWTENGNAVSAGREYTVQSLAAGKHDFAVRITKKDGSGCVSAWSDIRTVIVEDVQVVLTVDNNSYCEGGSAILTAVVTNSVDGDYTYEWYKDGAVIAGADGKTYTSQENARLEAYRYYVVVKSKSDKACEATSNIIDVLVNNSAANLIEHSWNNVLTVINNPDNNGGYKFYSYQWYKDGVAIPGATMQYYEDPSGVLNGEYSVELRGKDINGNDVAFVSCPTEYTYSFSAKISPVPAKPNQQLTLTVTLTEEELAGAKLEIYSTTGVLQQRISKVTPETYIDGIAVQSTYLARLTLADGTVQVIKFIVK